MLQGSGSRMPRKGWRFYFSFSPEERRRFWTDVVGALTFRLFKDRFIDWLLAPFYYVGWKLLTAFVAVFIFGESLADKTPAPAAPTTAAATPAPAQPRPDSSYWGPSPGATQSTSSSYGARPGRHYTSMEEARAQDQQVAQRQAYEFQQRQRQMDQARTQIQPPSTYTTVSPSPARPAYTPTRTTPAYTAPRPTPTYTPPRPTPTYRR